MPRIRQVKMQNFRGAAGRSELEFKNKPLILIFGENGTGKSTVVDAIDLVCNESYGTIDERSSATRKDHLPTIGSSTAQVEVQIDFDAGVWKGHLNSSGKVQVTGGSNRPAVRVLRRRSLLKLTEDTPGNRYEQLQSLIDVKGVEKAENQLKEALDQLSKRLDDVARTIGSARDQIQALWEAEGKPIPNALHWARNRIREDQKHLRGRIETLEQDIHHSNTLLGAQSALEDATVLYKRAEDRLNELELSLSQSGEHLGAALASLLEQARAYGQQTPDTQTCPVCEQRVNAQELQRQLERRLSEAQHLNDLNRQRQAARRGWEEARHTLEGSRTNLTQAQAQAGMSHLYSQQLERHLEQQRAELNTLRRTLEHHAALTHALNTLDEAHVEAQQHEATTGRLQAMFEALRATRLSFVQNIFDGVRDEAQRLYQAIHPHEQLGLTALQLDPSRRASLHQKGHFYGHHDITPQGLYSEAHLDTLGFCFWLAVIKHTTPSAIVVLDDVFTSVDARHLSRIDELLLHEAQSGAFAQVVVITHYRGWLDKFKNAMPNDLQVLELLPWTLAHGIRVHGTLPNTLELGAKLNEPHLDRQGAAGKAGVLLEALLDHFSLEFKLELPRNALNAYTLDPLIKKSLSKAKSFKTQHPDALEGLSWQVALERLSALTFIRNQAGAHFNVGAADLSDADILEFAGATLELAHLMTCPVCGQRAYRKDHGTHRSCGGECKQTRVFLS